MALPLSEFLLRLFVALLLGLGIGLEREYRSDTPRAAGMRTLAMVTMGSALFTLISAYGFASFRLGIDPSRIAAQIVTGIGFLGAGAILLHRQAVRGLTTAAAIWATAAIGMACGLGLYLESIGATALALTVLEVLRPIESRLFPRHQLSRIRIRTNPDTADDPLVAIQAVCRELGLTPRKFVMQETPRGALIELDFSVRHSDELLELTQRFRALPMVRAIRTEVVAPKGGVRFTSPAR